VLKNVKNIFKIVLFFFQDIDGAQKRNSLEDLNKEDLIKKCKSLLIIAQRAKQAKDGKILGRG
jgi:hypothetical protein